MSLIFSDVSVDVITFILTFLNHKNIFKFCFTSKFFYSLYNSVKNAKLTLTNGYPRVEGRCVIHFLPEGILTNEDLTKHYFQKNNWTGKSRGPSSHQLLYDFQIQKRNKFVNEKILNYYKKLEEPKLVKGDLISLTDLCGTIDPNDFDLNYYLNSDNKIKIFDGEKILETSIEHGKFTYVLPSNFPCITNDIPIKYWSEIFTSSLIWLNMESIGKQCLENITYEKNEKLPENIKTSFLYDGEKYDIFYDFLVEINKKRKTYAEEFKKYLEESISGEQPVQFTYNPGMLSNLVKRGQNVIYLQKSFSLSYLDDINDEDGEDFYKGFDHL